MMRVSYETIYQTLFVEGRGELRRELHRCLRSGRTRRRPRSRVERRGAIPYRRPELRAIVEEHRRSDREAHSFSGIVIEIDLLRQGLEAVAAKARRHEEELRSLRRQISKEK